MKIDLKSLSEDGLVQGEAPASPYDLPAEAGLAWDKVQWDLVVSATEEDVVVTGSVAAKLKLPCARCLEPLPWAIEVPDFQWDASIPDDEVIDLTPAIREDILLNFPIAPGCTLTEDSRCPVTGASHASGPDEFSERSRGDIWSALDDLNEKKE